MAFLAQFNLEKSLFMVEKNGSSRAEFFTDEDRRAMRIRIPIHPAFLEDLPNESNFKDSVKQNKNSLIEDLDEKATKKLTNITLIK